MQMTLCFQKQIVVLQILAEEHNEQFGSINSLVSTEDKRMHRKNENMHVIGNTIGNTKSITSRYSDQLNHKHFQGGKIRTLDYFLISF